MLMWYVCSYLPFCSPFSSKNFVPHPNFGCCSALFSCFYWFFFFHFMSCIYSVLRCFSWHWFEFFLCIVVLFIISFSFTYTKDSWHSCILVTAFSISFTSIVFQLLFSQQTFELKKHEKKFILTDGRRYACASIWLSHNRKCSYSPPTPTHYLLHLVP